ncbi:MAG TPA: dihydrofolate reductase [Lacipirellulaceae bacterium]
MRVSIIAAVAENGVIGRDGNLPWHLSADLRRFKQLTMGHTVIMGRRTWESIGRSLPGRRMVVVSRQPGYHVDAQGIEVAASLDDALKRAAALGDDEAFVIGGETLFKEALPRADRLYYTSVRANVSGDVYFPDVEWSQWRLIESVDSPANEKNDYPSTFKIYERQQA